MKQYVLIVALAVLVIMGCVSIPFEPRHSVSIPTCFLPLLLASELIIGFTFIQDKVNVLYPFHHRAISGSSATDRIRNTFHHGLIVRPPKTKLKNLVFLEIESMELAYIGRFNRNYPLSMPWLSEITQNYTYFTNFVSQPYTTWSAAGMVVTQCGLPLVVPEVLWPIRRNEKYVGFDHVACIPNILSQLGYQLLAYCSGDCTIMQMKQFMSKKGYSVQDSAEHHKLGDSDLFEWLDSPVLPKLTHPSQWPFALLILTADTHTPFHIRRACNNYLANSKYPKVYRSFTCLDQYLKHFIERFQELGLGKNAEVLIYGDHLTIGNMNPFIHGQRNLSLFLSLRLQDPQWRRAQFGKTMSYYDFAPTIMDLLKIEYSPRFPFGESLFGEKSGPVPTITDLQFIYQVMFGNGHNATCHGRPGMCRGNEN
jgi:phosphoglycerol transferase